MRESTIESYLVEQCELYGATCEKFKSPGRKNVPDRLCTWPGQRFTEWGEARQHPADVDMVELKAPGKEPNDGQLRDHKRRRQMGQRVFVIDTKTGVDMYIRMARRRMIGDDVEECETTIRGDGLRSGARRGAF